MLVLVLFESLTVMNFDLCMLTVMMFGVEFDI